MTTISDTLIGPDGTADWDDGSTIRFEADEPRDAGGKILTTRPEPVPVNTDGTFSATLQPGRYTVRVRSGNSLREQMGPWPILVPASGTSRLWPLIAVAVGQSPDISYQRLLAAVQAYLEANPIEGGGDLTKAVADQTYAPFVTLAKNPDLLITGAITRDANQAVTSAAVTWPDGTAGTFTAETLSSAFPGAVDGYRITYGNPVTKTYTQPTLTRNAAGAATAVPAIVVS